MNDYDKVPTAIGKEEPTMHLIEQRFDELRNAVDRFEKLIDTFEGGGSLKEKSDSADKQIITVAGQWRMIPGRLMHNIEKMHKNIDRLENLFR